jgi:hypothetical protein
MWREIRICEESAEKGNLANQPLDVVDDLTKWNF